MKYALLFVSVILGTLYYYMMESSLPKDSNCSFIATVWTDILAFICGLILIYKGFNHNDNILVLLGGILITEHIWQILPKYTINKLK